MGKRTQTCRYLVKGFSRSFGEWMNLSFEKTWKLARKQLKHLKRYHDREIRIEFNPDFIGNNMCPICGEDIKPETKACYQGDLMMPDGCPFNQIGFSEWKRKNIDDPAQKRS